MKKNIVVLAALALGAISVTAQEDAPSLSVSTSLAYDSMYVFRGVQISEDIFEPSVDFSYGDFYAGLWFAVPDSNASDYVNEMDIYFGYTKQLTDLISIDVGATHYAYDQFIDDIFDNKDNSLEGYVGVSLDVFLAPSFYIYRDFDYSTFAYQFGISHSIPLIDSLSLDLSANVGEVVYDNGDDGTDYCYGGATADLTYAINDESSISVGARYGVASTASIYDDLDDPDMANGAVWFGGSFSTSF